MEPKQFGGLILVLIGLGVLAKNLHVPFLQAYWPLGLVILGIFALIQSNSRKTKTYRASDGTVWEVNEESPLLKGLVAIPALFIAAIIGLIILGILGPFFLIFLLFVPLILFAKLGWAFIRLLLPIFFLVLPFLFVVWILALLF